ncbi:MAG: hypothetical protein JKZ00_06510 [Flavobacteriaceae bacterium]|nr:hypothetical protein [Flavobacteriaceae bacterium]
MKDRTTILNLLNKFSNDHKNISWKIECSFSDGMGTTINEIKIIAQPSNRSIGVFVYKVETGMVLFCMYKKLKKSNSRNIVDMLLDMINYSKGENN